MAIVTTQDVGTGDGPADLELGPPQARITVESVTVKRGQTLTVYMRTAEGQQQVELRVTSTGLAEIFADHTPGALMKLEQGGLDG